jgi:hypothetical protein
MSLLLFRPIIIYSSPALPSSFIPSPASISSSSIPSLSIQSSSIPSSSIHYYLLIIIYTFIIHTQRCVPLTNLLSINLFYSIVIHIFTHINHHHHHHQLSPPQCHPKRPKRPKSNYSSKNTGLPSLVV